MCACRNTLWVLHLLHLMLAQRSIYCSWFHLNLTSTWFAGTGDFLGYFLWWQAESSSLELVSHSTFLCNIFFRQTYQISNLGCKCHKLKPTLKTKAFKICTNACFKSNEPTLSTGSCISAGFYSKNHDGVCGFTCLIKALLHCASWSTLNRLIGLANLQPSGMGSSLTVTLNWISGIKWM